MHIRIRNEFIYLNVIVVILIIIVNFFPSNVFRIIFATPVMLLFPGYTLIAAIYPRKERLEILNRLIISLGVSIAVVSGMGLILGYLPIGISLESTLYSVSGFIFITSIIAWIRRRNLSLPESPVYEFRLHRSEWRTITAGRLLSVILVIAVLAALGTMAFVLTNPVTGELFTEFYVKNTGGETIDYPENIIANEKAGVILGIVNHEKKDTTYRFEIRISDAVLEESEPITLRDGESWEDNVEFAPVVTGDNQKLEFLLFRENETEPYRSVYLWINVLP